MTEKSEQAFRTTLSNRQRHRGAAVFCALFPLLFVVVFAACGVFESNRERCERKCGDDEAIYNPDDDTCFCRSRE